MSGDEAAAIVRDGQEIVVDAAVIASRFGLSAEEFRAEMAQGRIATLCERGIGEDEGRLRVTFKRGPLLWRFVLEADGRVREDPVLGSLGRRPREDTGASEGAAAQVRSGSGSSGSRG